MGIDYTYSLCMGFELPENTVKTLYMKSIKDEGSFHMEDRFDPKTGIKLAQEKVWDRKPKTNIWYEIDGEKYEDDLELEQWTEILSEKFKCYVEVYGCFMSGELTFVFQVNKPVSYQDARNEGKSTFYNESISCEEVFRLLPQALLLQSELEKAGLKVGKPRVFLAESVS